MAQPEFKRDSVIEEGDLIVYAVPYFANKVIFLPCPMPAGHVPHDKAIADTEDWKPIEEQEHDDDLRFYDGNNSSMSDKLRRKSSNLKAWIQKKRKHRYDSELPIDKFMKRIPKNINRIRIMHASSMDPVDLMVDMQHQVVKSQSKRSAKIIGYTAALPFALLLDLLTFAFVFTVADLAMIYSNSKKLSKGGEVEELMNNGKIQFETYDVLDKFCQEVKATKYTMPTDNMVQDLCERLDIEVLAKTVRKVRNAEAAKMKIDIAKFEDDSLSGPSNALVVKSYLAEGEEDKKKGDAAPNYAMDLSDDEEA
jgi:hypothetical protein